MARSRNIKPGFFKNERLAECPPLTSLLFAGLWCLADRDGRLEDRPKRIRAELLPYDDGSVDGMLDELNRAGFIQRYEANGCRFIQVLSFAKHQNPHHREAKSTIPAPGENTETPPFGSDEPRASLGLSSDKPGTSPELAVLIPDSLNLIPLNTCLPVASESADDGFADFWAQYPRKVAKADAVKAWKRVKPKDRPAVMAALDVQKASDGWTKDGGRFVPYPASWLRAERWMDEQPTQGCVAPADNSVFAGAL